MFRSAAGASGCLGDALDLRPTSASGLAGPRACHVPAGAPAKGLSKITTCVSRAEATPDAARALRILSHRAPAGPHGGGAALDSGGPAALLRGIAGRWVVAAGGRVP